MIIDNGVSIHPHTVTITPKPHKETNNSQKKTSDNDQEEGDEDNDKPSTTRLSRHVKKMIILRLLDQCDYLKSKANYLATDFVQNIVSWKELFPIDVSEQTVTIELRPDSTNDRKCFGIKVKRQYPIYLGLFHDHLMGKAEAINCNTTPRLHACSTSLCLVTFTKMQNIPHSKYRHAMGRQNLRLLPT
jgi:hypothetical protein